MKTEEVIIIGSGPAGYTAAIYIARAQLSPLLFSGQSVGGQPGGQLMLTNEVENFPGFPEGLMGPELMERCKRQAEKFGTRIVSEDVTAADFSSRPFKVSTASQTHGAKAVLICTGAQATWLGVPGEREYQGRGVSACATCDGFFFSRQGSIGNRRRRCGFGRGDIFVAFCYEGSRGSPPRCFASVQDYARARLWQSKNRVCLEHGS